MQVNMPLVLLFSGALLIASAFTVQIPLIHQLLLICGALLLIATIVLSIRQKRKTPLVLAVLCLLLLLGLGAVAFVIDPFAESSSAPAVLETPTYGSELPGSAEIASFTWAENETTRYLELLVNLENAPSGSYEYEARVLSNESVICEERNSETLGTGSDLSATVQIRVPCEERAGDLIVVTFRDDARSVETNRSLITFPEQSR